MRRKDKKTSILNRVQHVHPINQFLQFELNATLCQGKKKKEGITIYTNIILYNEIHVPRRVIFIQYYKL